MLEYYKEAYYYELEHKDKIHSRISLPASIIPLLIASALYLLNHADDLMDDWKVYFYITLSLYTIAIGVTLRYIMKALFNHEYAYMTDPNRIASYKKSLKGNYSDEIIEEEMLDFLSEQFAENATRNSKSNFNKLFYLRRSFYALTLALFLGLTNLIPLFFGKDEKSEINKVEVVNIQKQGVNQNMSNNDPKPPKDNRPPATILNENFTKRPPEIPKKPTPSQKNDNN